METEETTRLAYLESMGIQVWSLRKIPAGLQAAEEESAALPYPDQQIPVTGPIVLSATNSNANQETSKVEPILPGHGQNENLANQLPPTLNTVELTPPPNGGRLGGGRSENSEATAFTRPHPNPPPLGEGTVELNSTILLPTTHQNIEMPVSVDAPKTSRLLVPTCNWDGLQAQVAACTACTLHQTRTQTVFGVGDRNANWMVIGEAPGEQEDLQGEPFVGRAGLLLNEMLRGIGLEREQVFIANILKCRPPKNRDPQVEDAAACETYLKQQLGLVNPKIILAVGRIAAQNLLKTTTPIGKLRGLVHDYQGVPLVVTYHRAYLLRSPLEKRRAF